jgi:hypothetical protein
MVWDATTAKARAIKQPRLPSPSSLQVCSNATEPPAPPVFCLPTSLDGLLFIPRFYG